MRRGAVNLTFWITVMIALGLLAMGLMFVFVAICDRV